MTGNIHSILLALILLVAAPFNAFACWEDDDDSCIYGDYDDDCEWLDDVYIDDYDDQDNEFDDDWWRREYDDYEDNNEDDDNFSYDDDDGESIGQDYTESTENKWSALQKYYRPGVGEMCLWWDRWDDLPAHLPKQQTKMGCVPQVLEYVMNYLDGTLTEGYIYGLNSFILATYFEISGMNADIYGVLPSYMPTLMNEIGLYFDNILNYNEIKEAIYKNEAAIATIENEYGLHEVFIISFLDNGDFKGYDPGTGNIELISKENIYKVYVIHGFK